MCNVFIIKAFLSKLYTYLVDEMHKGLGKTFSLEQSAPDPPNIVDCDMLRLYALEAEVRINHTGINIARIVMCFTYSFPANARHGQS